MRSARISSAATHCEPSSSCDSFLGSLGLPVTNRQSSYLTPYYDVRSEQRSLFRTLLLPSEVDDMTRDFNEGNGMINEADCTITNMKDKLSEREQITKCKDESTVTSDTAMSLDDEAVFRSLGDKTSKKIIEMFYDNHPQKTYSDGDNESVDYNSDKSNASGEVTRVKLPRVGTKENMEEKRKMKHMPCAGGAGGSNAIKEKNIVKRKKSTKKKKLRKKRLGKNGKIDCPD